MRGSGTNLSLLERENAYLRNGRDRTLCVRAEPAVGGDERVQIKEILKMMVSGTAKSAKKCQMVMLRNGFFGNICENDMLRNGNSGLKMGVSRAAHTQYATPPPVFFFFTLPRHVRTKMWGEFSERILSCLTRGLFLCMTINRNF